MKSRLVSGELQTSAGQHGGQSWVTGGRVRVEGAQDRKQGCRDEGEVSEQTPPAS